jgi:ComEC/Rec2-related protein
MRLSPFLSVRVIHGACAAFLAGIALHASSPYERLPFYVWWGMVPGIAAFFLFPEKRVRQAVLLFFCFFLGLWRFEVTIPLANEGLSRWVGSEAHLRGSVTARQLGKTKPAYQVDVHDVNGEAVPHNHELSLYLDSSEVPVGATVVFDCALKQAGTLPAFVERKKSLAKQGIWTECRETKVAVQVLDVAVWYPPRLLADMRERLNARIQELLPTDEAFLLSGMLYGAQEMPADEKEVFRRAGLLHLVAVSGSNVTIVVSVFMALALGCGLRRRQAFWIVTLALAWFVGLVGLSASVLRAACMGWLLLLARELGRLAWFEHILLVAAVVLCAVNPWLLLFDAGFALSFLAMWGLLAWSPWIEQHLFWLPESFGVRGAVATTLGATLMTAPYLSWMTGTLSFTGLLTNVFALPLVPFIMLWGSVALVGGDLLSVVPVELPVRGLLRLLLLVSHWGATHPWLVWNVRLPVWALLGVYVLLVRGSSVARQAVKNIHREKWESENADELLEPKNNFSHFDFRVFFGKKLP